MSARHASSDREAEDPPGRREHPPGPRFWALGSWAPGFWALASLAGLVAAALTLHSTSRYGIGLSFDSAGYLALARAITERGPTPLTESFGILQPPLYPALVALVSVLTRSDPALAARLLGVALAFALPVLVLTAARRVTSFAPALAFVALAAVLSRLVVDVFGMAWTEPLFMVEVGALLLVLAPRRLRRSRVVLAGSLAAAACLTRFVGVLLVPVAAIRLLIAPRSEPALDRLGRTALFTLFPALATGLVLWRNQQIFGAPTGWLFPSQTGLRENLELTTGTLASWFLPQGAYGSTLKLTLLTLVVLIGVATTARSSLLPDLRRVDLVVPLAGLFTAVYLAFIVVSSTIKSYEPIGPRMLAPVYPALLILAAWLLRPRLWRDRRAPWIAAAVVAALFATGPMRAALDRLDVMARRGAGGYNSVVWQENDLIDYLRRTGAPSGRRLFSNQPGALDLLCGIEADFAPAAMFIDPDDPSLDLFAFYPGLEGELFVWFERGAGDFLPPAQLGRLAHLTPVHSTDDGAIYTVRRLP